MMIRRFAAPKMTVNARVTQRLPRPLPGSHMREMSSTPNGESKSNKIVYTHGHAAPVVQNHAARTAEDFAPHVVKILCAGDKILDVGCGPGSITKGFRKYVGPSGRIIGIDLEKKVLEEAKKIVGQDAEIQQGDVYNLQFGDKEFDVVHAHQVLQHLKNPVDALKEMKRVSKRIVACREVDYESWLWYPNSQPIQKWKDCYREVCRRNKADSDAGRKLKSWFMAAGFNPSHLQTISSTVMYSSPERTRFIAESWAKRVSETQLGDQMISYGLATRSDVEDMARAWREWGEKDDAVMFYVDVSVFGRAID